MLLKANEEFLVDYAYANDGTDYTKKEIEEALNTLIDGYGTNNDTYHSIMDIPAEHLIVCVKQIDIILDGTTNSLQDEINERI